MPISIPGVQRVIAASLSLRSPRPSRRPPSPTSSATSSPRSPTRGYHDHLDVKLTARVRSRTLQPPRRPVADARRPAEEIAALWSLAADSPHHFLAASPRVPLDPRSPPMPGERRRAPRSVQAAAMELCLAIHRDFKYDKDATKVDTGPSEAFALKRGVCQDFAHVMIAGLRGIGIPAGYVSGFLRTIPPKGKPRLEGADAMHAWVRVWCGPHAGWVEFDPTNAMLAGPDHITIGHGRDYSDVSPIVGVLRTSGGHHAKQSVDVIRVE
jgi:transglutaminase-like putative cysteine protease